MSAAVDELVQRSVVAPDREVEEGRAGAVADHAETVIVACPEAPEETVAVLGEVVDRRERGQESAHPGVVEWRAQTGDVGLCEFRHPGSVRPTEA